MLTANGLRFYVEDEGRGQPVLLLHGFPDTSHLWRAQIAALASAGYRAIAPDLRGRGRSDKPSGVEAYGLGLIVQDVAGLMGALGIERAHVVGHDWGAAVAWGLAAMLPGRVERLAVISVPHPGASGRPTLEQLQKGWYRLLFQFEGVAEALVREDDWYLMRELLQGQGDSERYVADLAEPGALAAALNWYRANLPPDRLLARSSFPHVQAPTLGIFGDRDLYLSEEPMRRSGEFVDGPWRYERFADAGHWVPLDQPERLNRLLLEFLGA
jgi:pimeloyl-ACP methyl ester carboxylesterase